MISLLNDRTFKSVWMRYYHIVSLSYFHSSQFTQFYKNPVNVSIINSIEVMDFLFLLFLNFGMLYISIVFEDVLANLVWEKDQSIKFVMRLWMKMRLEDYKYTEKKPRMIETWENAENLGIHQKRKIMDTLFSLDCFCVCETLYMLIHIQVLVSSQAEKKHRSTAL